MIEHLARNWGNWASVAGLVFSILAFVFSKRASKAAQEARDSILWRTSAQEMMEAEHMAVEISRFVSEGRGEMALLRADDLWRRVGYCANRWDTRLTSQSKVNLGLARDQLQVVRSVLAARAIPDLKSQQKAGSIKLAGMWFAS